MPKACHGRISTNFGADWLCHFHFRPWTNRQTQAESPTQLITIAMYRLPRTWLTSKDEGKISGAIYELTQSILSQQSRHLDALKMKELRKILRVSWTAKKTIEWVLNKAGVQRTEINGESTFTVWPTFRSRTAEEQNRTDIRQVISCTATYRPLCAASLLLLSNITYQWPSMVAPSGECLYICCTVIMVLDSIC